MNLDPYTDSESGVLRNRFGIIDAAKLQAVESDMTQLMIARLDRERLPGSYDLAHLQAFHDAIFGAVYPWAGQIRTVAIAKSDVFCLPQHIENYGRAVFEQLARERHLQGLSREKFVDRLTVYYAEANALHPFREGNGRTQRAFFRQLARDAGHALRWDRLDPETNTKASVASLRGENEPLRAVLEKVVQPLHTA